MSSWSTASMNVDVEVSKVLRRGRFFSCNESRTDLLSYNRDEISIGQCVGKGSFSEVYEITSLSSKVLKESREATLDAARPNEDSIVTTTRPGAFVLKQLKKPCKVICQDSNASEERKEKKHFYRAAIHLLLEAEYLSRINHENIVSLRGMGNRGSNDMLGSFFIVLDRMDETLLDRLQRWNSAKGSKTTGAHIEQSNDCTMQQGVAPPALKRLEYALDIAKALDYLHNRRLIFRDLKPDNIGFKTGEQIQLFDFGLCRELPRSLYSFGREGRYHMTYAGTRRYMAPEVITGRGYNLKADVYSWSIVAYELLSLNKAFDGYDRKSHRVVVCEDGERPNLDDMEFVSNNVKGLLNLGWSQCLKSRLNIATVCSKLNCIIQVESESSFPISPLKRLQSSGTPEDMAHDSDFNVPVGKKSDSASTADLTAASSFSVSSWNEDEIPS